MPQARQGAGAVVRWSAGLVGSVAVLAGLLAGCSTSATYLGSTGQEFYFKAPKHWYTLSSSDLQSIGLPTAAQDSQLKAQGASYPVYATLASPVAHLGRNGLAGSDPWVLGLVKVLGSTDQTGTSLSSLEDEIFNVSGASSSGLTVKALQPSKLVVKGGLRGTLVEYQLGIGASSLAFEQEAVMNSPTNKVWVLAAGCSARCFVSHQRVLEGIVKSFTVTAQGG